MKLGAERNKVILLIVLSVIAAVTVYVQFFAAGPTVPIRQQAPLSRNAGPNAADRRAAPRGLPVRVRGQDFRPTFKRSGDDEPLDPTKIDPTLRTDLLAKVRAVDFQGVERNLFQFSERKKVVAPPPKEAVNKAQGLLKNMLANRSKAQSRIKSKANPKAPPIKMKYYGFANAPGDGRKRAFLLDGEEILIGTEGDVFQKRYKIVRIGINSIVVEDMQFKDQQTLPLEES